MAERIAVVGGGLGGLTGAVRLAAAGHDVHLYERNARLGGKVGELRLGDFRFDTGPSLLTLPEVIDDLYEEVERERDERLIFDPVDPLCRYFWRDGSTLDMHQDPELNDRELADFAPEDRENLPRFLRYSRQIWDAAAEAFLFTPFHEIHRLMKPRLMSTLLGLPRLDAFRKLHEAVEAHFQDPRLVQLFDRYATYNGSDPFQASATLNIIAHVEMTMGGYYVRGGMYRLVEALEALAEDVGVTVHLNAEVEEIVHDGERVRGVRVEDELVDADRVLVNADVVDAHVNLLAGPRKTRRALDRMEPSLSGMVFLWGVRARSDRLAHHNVFFSDDYRAEFRQLFGEKQPPDDPTVYVALTNRADPGHSPVDGENAFVLLNMPYLTEGQDWDEAVKRMRDKVLARLAEHGVEWDGSIEEEKVIDPRDFAQQFRANRGSIYGLSSNSRASAFRRPPNRSRVMKRLYFASGSVHPGGGIPLAIQSGRLAADIMLGDAT